ncbi:TetR/AcrR family transcriptional regulator [Microlunatus parietis]|uniref:AcrR family transcriptional regulator n=1 Tax=Microlunatus parietis TaxID=682979 RepID=A0A7Y9IF39_9ACTN|nr:TetR/AcrR family transcriptional regulator [Microlunatus parietis]NYE75368.1 AcrR family transcriptional regulator [Microlunatus parietis]
MSDPVEQELPRAVAMAWGIAANPQRGPKRELSHELIVEAAIGIADAEGLGAVTMSRVASSLGFTTMSLYRYVTSKDDLLVLMADAASEVSYPEGSWGDDWRANMWDWAALLRGCYRDHPWLLEINRTPSLLMTPNNMAVVDLGLRALRPARLELAEKIALIMVVSMYVRSFCELEQEVADEEIDLARDAWAAEAQAGALRELVTPDRFPDLYPMVVSGEYFGTSESQLEDADFRFGLDRLLDGFARYLEAVGDRTAPDAEPPPEPPEIGEFARDEVRRDKAVRAAAAKRREAEAKRRDADIKVREAVQRERDAIAKAVERAAKIKSG